MANRFLDSVAHYATADLTLKYSAINSNVAVNATSGRWGGQAVRLISAASHFERQVGDNQATLIAGCAVTIATVGSQINALIAFFDGTSGQVQLVLDTAGKLAVYRVTGNTTGTLLGTATMTAWANGATHYVELKATIHASAGTIDVQLDGVSVLTLTGQDTNQTANAYANKVRFGNGFGVQGVGGSSAITCDFGDLYINDGSGTLNNGFEGDMRVYCQYPSGAGNSSQWTPSAGSNYQNVDEAQQNGDTDYVSDGTVGHIDTYAMQDIPSSATVRAVQTILVARKDDTGTRQVAPVLRPASTDRVGTTVTLSAVYQMFMQQYDVSPETSSAFTASEVNGMEAGSKVIA